MEIYKVPQREVPVRLEMHNGQILEGTAFVAASGTDGRPGRLLDRLNEPDEAFMPLVSGEDRVLLNKSRIVFVEVPREEVDGLDDDAVRRAVPVRVTLAGGASLIGRLAFEMPPQRSRIVDFLNAGSRFIPLIADDHVKLIHRSHVLFVRPLADEAR